MSKACLNQIRVAGENSLILAIAATGALLYVLLQ